MTAGQHTLSEIMSQPDVWGEALAAFEAQERRLQTWLASAAFDQVIVTGCGSTYYLALTAARLLRQAGCPALACPASELLLHQKSICLPGHNALLLSVSRSGTTSETVHAQTSFKDEIGGPILTITCDGSSPLADSADLVISIAAAQEKSVAQTRSFSSMLVLIQQLAATLGKQDLSASRPLPAACRHLLERCENLARSLGENNSIDRFFFLGSDALYGIACEVMLKMKEMSLSYSEAYHTLEFRHGPMSMVGEDSLVIGLISPGAARHEIRVLSEMADMGANILAIGQKRSGFANQLLLPAELPPWSTPVLHLPALQLLAYYRAMFTGCDPDNPRQLSAVVSLDDL